MKRDTDFFHVAARHEAIHLRLINWARWCRPNFSASIHPMFRACKPSQQWEASEPRQPVDSIDAQRIEKSVSALPERHKHAIRWSYVYRIAPGRVCRELGVSHEGLMGLVEDGRDLLADCLW